jgi:Cysteine-rich CPCC
VEQLTYPCPSCGFLVFEEPAGSYDICPICNWEDDHVQLRHPLMGGGANTESLFESQQNILHVVPAEVKEYRGHLRCVDWRPLGRSDLGTGVDAPETSVGYFNAAAADSPAYYWEKKPQFSAVSEWFQVRFDDARISLQVNPPQREPWVAAISWERIVRVCFKAGDWDDSDVIYIFTDERPESYLIPSEADVGGALWNEILRRKLFDAEIAIEAMSSTNKLFCCPAVE